MHHIRHDQHDLTLCEGIYDSLVGHNFAALTEGQNHEVEIGSERQRWEDRFIYMWECFLRGDNQSATEHWNEINPKGQQNFIRELKSRRYLDWWLKNL